MNSTDTNAPRTIDNTTGSVLPTRTKRIDLAAIDDCRKELATVYRLMRNGDIESAMGTKLAYVLSTIGKMIVEHEFEKRITSLEENKND